MKELLDYLFTWYFRFIFLPAEVTFPQTELYLLSYLQFIRNSRWASTMHAHDWNLAPNGQNENTVEERFPLIVVLLVCSSINERSHKNAWMTSRAWRGKFKLTCSVARTRNSCHEQVSLAHDASEDDTGDSTSRKKSIYRSWENYKYKNVGKILKFEIMRNTQRDWARMEIVNTDFER